LYAYTLCPVFENSSPTAWKLGNGTTRLVVPLEAKWFENRRRQQKAPWGARMQLPKHGNFGIAP